ncbi:MAG: HNH endonuclease [Succiniclasticum sp.]|nr:HNH endonuclease [Succiniclasticum sp.]
MTQKEFYRSRAWKRLSKAFLLSRNYICERCGQPAEIAHHKIYLTAENVTDPAISLNPDNLEALCQSCHNIEHFGQGGATAARLFFDDNGNLIQKGRNNHE